MKGKLAIRLMKKHDLHNVASLYSRVYGRVDLNEERSHEASHRLMKYWFETQPDLCFIALLDNQAVGGFMAGIKPWWDGNRLINGEVFVDPAYQNRKIGSKLSKTIYKAARDKYAITSIDFTTYSNDGFPLGWYKKMGFKEAKHLIRITGKPKEIINYLNNIGKTL